tara:strand:+ start:5208 stop:5735 length:528 start_codon:yes stop_codon:yes gene_type:complete
MRFDISVKNSEILPEIKLFKPTVGGDSRGEIWTIWEKENVLPNHLSFNLCKFTKSTKGVLRGLHGCYNTWKYMSVPQGEVFFVVVDIRKNSPNYLKYQTYVLNEENHNGVLVPPGFVNGHLCLSETCLYHYMMSYKGDYIEPHEQVVLTWNDKRLNIPWPTENPTLSKRDMESNI